MLSPKRIFIQRLVGEFATVFVLGLALSGGLALAQDLECPPCDDRNACTVDSCDTAYGTCVHRPLDCDDGDPCTLDSCNPGPAAGGCRHEPVADFSPCDDGNTCTPEDVCVQGTCAGAAFEAGTPCDDHDPCTSTDTCDVQGRCSGALMAEGAACEDGDACTTATTCVREPSGDLACRGTTRACDDGNPCTDDACDPATGQCTTSPTNCDDGNICTLDGCDPAAGGCTRDLAVGPCDDFNPCTDGDQCQGRGICAGAPSSCDDGLACTDDSCDPATGCRHAENCDDGTTCTSDVCTSSGCSFVPQAGTPCTPADRCLICIVFPCRLACVDNELVCGGAIPRDCRDDSRCTTNEHCNPATGGCVSDPVTCNDDNPCTFDGTCEFMTGCPPHHFQPGPCDDQNACTTGDACVETVPGLFGVCQGSAVSCDDGLQCTADSCDPATGDCHHEPGSSCDDGNPCTVDGVCDATGACPPKEFQPGDCDDHDPCTMADTCVSTVPGQVGACRGTPRGCDDGDPCTTDSCDPATGQCGHAPAVCDDGSACTDDFCSPATGQCMYVPRNCDDGDVCTSDRCETATGCHHDPALDCDDHDPCTLDRCDPVAGCVHEYDPALPDGDHDGVPDQCDSCAGAPNADQADGDHDGFGDACDVCPTIPNPGQDPEDCHQAVVDIVIVFTTFESGSNRKDGAYISWRTTHEVNLSGFNVVSYSAQGNRTQLNAPLIPCTACTDGTGASYSGVMPKHKSGRDLYIELIGTDGSLLGLFGPAVRQ